MTPFQSHGRDQRAPLWCHGDGAEDIADQLPGIRARGQLGQGLFRSASVRFWVSRSCFGLQRSLERATRIP